MAEDAGGLLVQIGVTQARMERELAKLVKSAAKSAGDMEKEFDAANNNIGKSAGKAFDGMAAGATKAAGAVKNTSFATSNMAAQLNDVAVSLAGGQSPFTVMLQQGTQITQLFNQTGGSIRGFGQILAGAVTQVLNPFSLLTFAIIGVGGYALQYFMDVVKGGQESNDVIEEQQKLINSVAQTWGDAVPALQAYVEQLQQAKDTADLIQASNSLANDQWAVARKEINDLDLSFAELIMKLQEAGEKQAVLTPLNTAFQEISKSVREGTATQEQFQAVQDALAAAVNSVGIPAIGEFAAEFEGLGQTIAGATRQATRFREEAIAALTTGKNGPNLGQLSPLYSEGGKFVDPATMQPSGDVPKPTSRPLYELEGPYSTAPKSGGGQRFKNRYADEVMSIKERTTSLRESTAAQAAINPLVNDYGFALEKAKAEQKLLADAQRSGVAITPELRGQISTLAEGYASASAEAKKLAEQQNEVKKRAQEWASLEKDVFKGFISDIAAGKNGLEALGSALNKVADKLLDMVLNDVFSTKGSGGGSGIFGSIFSGIGKIFGYASGTANTGGARGQPRGIVHGQEAVIPLPAGGAVPVQISSPTLAGSGSGSNDVVTITLQDDSGRMANIADQRIRTASGTIVQLSVQQSVKQVKANMPTLMTDAQERAL